MKWVLGVSAAALISLAGGGAANASVCSNSCDHNYSVCNALNGGNAQQMCMPKWFQCKKSCTATPPARTPTRVSNVTPPQKH